MSTRQGAANTKRVDSIGTPAGQVSRERLGSTVTFLQRTGVSGPGNPCQAERNRCESSIHRERNHAIAFAP